MVAPDEPKKEYVIDLTVPEEDDWLQKLRAAALAAKKKRARSRRKPAAK